VITGHVERISLARSAVWPDSANPVIHRSDVRHAVEACQSGPAKRAGLSIRLAALEAAADPDTQAAAEDDLDWFGWALNPLANAFRVPGVLAPVYLGHPRIFTVQRLIWDQPGW
jgi:hypothetical protein